MIMTYEPIHANDLGHPFQTLQWKHTDVRRDGADCITFLANAVGNKLYGTRTEVGTVSTTGEHQAGLRRPRLSRTEP